MPEWMRSQFMAPAYALLISLAVALVLGFSMNKPAEQGNKTEAKTPAPATVSIHLVTKEVEDGIQISKPVRTQGGLSVTVRRNVSGENLRTDENGKAQLAFTDGPLTVCVSDLPENLTGVGVTSTSDQRSPCWEFETVTNPLELQVRKGG
jgi:hypothetical protein